MVSEEQKRIWAERQEDWSCIDCGSPTHNPECNECLTNEISTKCEEIDTNLIKRMNDIKESHKQLGTCHPSDIGYMIEQIELLSEEIQ